MDALCPCPLLDSEMWSYFIFLYSILDEPDFQETLVIQLHSYICNNKRKQPSSPKLT